MDNKSETSERHKVNAAALEAYANGDISVISKIHRVHYEPQKKRKRLDFGAIKSFIVGFFAARM
ncbi:hypothetical protein AGMMS49975_30160 [Clostridia bacterium]|nr:hypothetical protein AGMMS49975_30160 [Clostridia bacterium]